MLEQYLENIRTLSKKSEPFATVVVVRREAPSSGKTGDKAVINQSGEVMGWVGGGCVDAIVKKEAEDAMKTGKARLVRIGYAPSTTKEEGVMEYKMTCQSDGAVEVFIDPVLPPPHVVVMGQTAIAKAVVKMSKAAGYRVTAVAPDADLSTFEKVDELITQMNLTQVKTTPATCIVIATQGNQDEVALEQALRKPHAYIGFVASRKKKASVSDYLQQQGLDAQAIAAVKSPAGIDIHAKTPEEVAVSILAEMISVRRTTASMAFAGFENSGNEAAKPTIYINPVCGVAVDTSNPRHVVEYAGEKVYFCCDGCKVKFELEPGRYVKAGESSPE